MTITYRNSVVLVKRTYKTPDTKFGLGKKRIFHGDIITITPDLKDSLNDCVTIQEGGIFLQEPYTLKGSEIQTNLTCRHRGIGWRK